MAQLPGEFQTLPERPDNEIPIRPYPLLRFWTFSVQLPVDNKSIDPLTGKAIIGDEWCIYGHVYLDWPVGETSFHPSSYAYRSEFVFLSKGADYYRVMLLKWNSDGLAERRGVGYIHEYCTSWLYRRVVWKEITLG